MKRKFLCFVICVVLIVPLFLSGCGDDIERSSSNSNKAMTLTIALSKGDNMTDAAIERVTRQLNTLSEAKYNTHLEFYFYSKSELENAILSKMSKISNIYETGGAVMEDDDGLDENGEEETDNVIIDEESGRSTTIYPEVTDTQFDIVLINGMEQYHKFMETEIFYDGEMTKGILTEIQPSTLVSQYVDNVLLTTCSTATTRSNGDGSIYAIPNNRDFGAYTFVIVNKELADKYYYNPAELTTHTDSEGALVTSIGALQYFFKEVYDDYGDQYVLLANDPGIEAVYYTADSSIPLGTSAYFAPGATMGTLPEGPPRNLYGTETFRYYYTVMNQLNKMGKMPTNKVADLKSNFAVAYVEGSYADLEGLDFDKYYINICNTPAKTNENVYSSMYGVTRYTRNAARATEIIEMFNSNKEFRNLMYYGVEGIDFVRSADTGEITRVNNGWDMDIYDGGNLFLLDSSKDLGAYYEMSKNDWESGKLLNRDAIIGLTLGFYFDRSKVQSAITSLQAKAKAWDTRLRNYAGNDIAGELKAIKDELDLSEEYAALTSQEEGALSLLQQYRTWYSEMVPR